MNALEQLEKILKENKYSKASFAEKLGFSKQKFEYHLKNLGKGKLSFKIEQIREIKNLLNFDLLNFF